MFSLLGLCPAPCCCPYLPRHVSALETLWVRCGIHVCPNRPIHCETCQNDGWIWPVSSCRNAGLAMWRVAVMSEICWTAILMLHMCNQWQYKERDHHHDVLTGVAGARRSWTEYRVASLTASTCHELSWAVSQGRHPFESSPDASGSFGADVFPALIWTASLEAGAPWCAPLRNSCSYHASLKWEPKANEPGPDLYVITWKAA